MFCKILLVFIFLPPAIVFGAPLQGNSANGPEQGESRQPEDLEEAFKYFKRSILSIAGENSRPENYVKHDEKQKQYEELYGKTSASIMGVEFSDYNTKEDKRNSDGTIIDESVFEYAMNGYSSKTIKAANYIRKTVKRETKKMGYNFEFVHANHSQHGALLTKENNARRASLKSGTDDLHHDLENYHGKLGRNGKNFSTGEYFKNDKKQKNDRDLSGKRSGSVRVVESLDYKTEDDKKNSDVTFIDERIFEDAMNGHSSKPIKAADYLHEVVKNETRRKALYFDFANSSLPQQSATLAKYIEWRDFRKSGTDHLRHGTEHGPGLRGRNVSFGIFLTIVRYVIICVIMNVRAN